MKKSREIYQSKIYNFSYTRGMQPQTVDIAHGKTVTVFYLTVTNAHGGHDIMEDGSDPSSVDLLVKIPRMRERLIKSVFKNELQVPEGDILFDTYSIRVDDVAFDAEEVTLTVT